MNRAKRGVGRLRDPLRGHSPMAEGPYLSRRKQWVLNMMTAADLLRKGDRVEKAPY